jgi:hypothetical protein
MQSALLPHFSGAWSARSGQIITMRGGLAPVLEHLPECFYHHPFSDFLKTINFLEANDSVRSQGSFFA